MSTPLGRFARLPRNADEPVRPSRVDLAETIVVPARVAGLGAICDLGRGLQDAHSQTFKISEFALLDDGRRVILHSERGYGVGWGAGSETPGELATVETRESVTRQVLNTVLPDWVLESDDMDDDEVTKHAHPWEWLAELARTRGLDVTTEDLRVLPYEVILNESVTRWLDAGQAPDG